MDFDGAEEMLNAKPDVYFNPKVSPDGDRIALTIMDDTGNPNIGILDIARGNIIHPIQDLRFVWSPIWSPISQKIAFTGSLTDIYTHGIYQMSSSGIGKIEHLHTEAMGQIYPSSFSKDGKFILCRISRPGTSSTNIGMLTIDEDIRWQIFLEDKYIKTTPQFSPDNEWIAYTSNKSGRNEVYVRSFPEAEEALEQISTDGGFSPLWSPNRSQLYYRNGDHVIAVTYDIKRGFKVVNSEVLFQDTYYSSAPPSDSLWDIHPNGKRFLMMKEAATDSKADKSRLRIDIIQNWFEELKERVPVD